MVRKCCALLLVAVLLALSAGCSQSSPSGSTPAAGNNEGTSTVAPAEKATEAAPAPAESQAKKKIALIITDSKAPYAAWMAYSFESVAKADYPQYEVAIFDSNSDIQTQTNHLENAAAQKFDYVLVQCMGTDVMEPKMYELVDRGIPVCVVNNSADSQGRCSNVDADIYEQGALPASVALEKIPQGGKVVILLGPSGNAHSIGRRKAWQEVLFDARPDIEILDEQIANWQKDEGMVLMEDWLQRFTQINAVISTGDGMALGAIEAAKAAGRNKDMTYYGTDGLADACLSIQAGDLTATCVQNAYLQAKLGLEMADKWITGENREIQIVYAPGSLVTIENADEWVQIHKESGQIK